MARQLAPLGRIVALGIAKLGNKIILHAIHAQAVEKAAGRQQPDLLGMARRKIFRQLDHHPIAVFQRNIHQIALVDTAPRIRRRLLQHIGGRLALRRIIGSGSAHNSSQRQSYSGFQHSFSPGCFLGFFRLPAHGRNRSGRRLEMY